jgi:hypothetical protein
MKVKELLLELQHFHPDTQLIVAYWDKECFKSMDTEERLVTDREWNDVAGSFVKAQTGNRSVGVLVKAVDSNGKDVYWTTRLADIIAPYAVLEPKWSQKNKEQEEKDRKQQELRNKVITHQSKVKAEIERSTGSIIQTSKELLGAGTYVSVDTEGYDLEYKGVVKLSLTEFEALIEMAYAGKDK